MFNRAFKAITSSSARSATLAMMIPLVASGCFHTSLSWVQTQSKQVSLAGPTGIVAGSCTPFDLIYLDDTLTQQNAPSTLTATLSSPTLGASFFTDSLCTLPLTGPATLIQGTPSATFYFLSTSAGMTEILASSNMGGTSSGSIWVAVNAGAPSATFSTISGNPKTGITADGTSQSKITLTLKDSFGNPVSGVGTTFASSGTGDTLTQPSTPTDTAGQTSGYLVSSVAETKSISISSPATLSTVGDVVTFTAAGSATLSTVFASPSSVPADGSSSAVVTVTINDASGTPILGKLVSLSSNRGAQDSISPGSGSTNSFGQIAFNVTSTTAGTATLTATDASDLLNLTSVATVSFLPGLTSTLSAASLSPSTLVADGATSSTLTVTLKDANGNLITGRSVAVASSRGGADTILTGTNPTNALGVATFQIYSTTAGIPSFTISAPSDAAVLSTTPSVTFNAGPTSPTLSQISASPSPVIADGASTTTVTVLLKDANGNPVPSANVSVTSSRGAQDTIAAISGTSNASGIATFSAKSTTAGTATFSATDTTHSISLSATSSVSFTVGIASASSSTLSSTSNSLVVGGATSTLTITLKDAFGNPAQGKSVSLSSNRGGVDTISAPSGASDASGVVTFTVSSTQAGTSVYTANDTSDAIILAATSSVNYTAGPASASTTLITAAPASAPADGVGTLTLTVSYRDAYNNPVSGGLVVVTSNRGGADTILPASATTNASGSAVFTASSMTPGSSVFTVNSATPPFNADQTATGTFVSGVTFADLPAFDFGKIGAGKAVDRSFRVSNAGATATLSFGTLPTGYTYKGGSYPGFGGTCASLLTNGESCTVALTFSPPTSGTYNFSYLLNYNNGSAQSVSLPINGAGTTAAVLSLTDQPLSSYSLHGLAPDPASWNFGQLGLGQSVTKTFTLTNTGNSTASSVSGIVLSTPFSFPATSSFPGAGGTCTGTLAPQQSCTVIVQFAPITTSPASATLTVNYYDGVSSSPSVTRDVAGSGTSGAVLQIYDYEAGSDPGILSGPAFDFGNGGVSTASNQHVFTVFNAGGTTAVNLGAGSLSTGFQFTGGAFPGGQPGAPGYSSTTPYCSSQLDPGQHCLIGITFNPASAGLVNGSIQVSHNTGSATRSVTGTGLMRALLLGMNATTHDIGAIIDLGDMGYNTSSTGSFLVTNQGGATATFTGTPTLSGIYNYWGSVYPGGSGISTDTFGVSYSFCGSSLAPGASCYVAISYLTTIGSNFGTFSANYNDGTGGATLSLGLTVKTPAFGVNLTHLAEYAYSNAISFSTTGIGQAPTHDFGAQAPGTYDTTFTLYTVGDATSINISDGGTLGGKFSYPGGSFPGGTPGAPAPNGYLYCNTLMPSYGTCSITVRYTASGNSFDTGTLTLNVTNSIAPTLAFNLKGTSSTAAIVRIVDGAFSDDLPIVTDLGTLGAPSDYILRVRNTGLSAATVTGSNVLGAGYSFTGGSFPGGSGTADNFGSSLPFCTTTLAANSSCALSVHVTPSGSTMFQGSVSLTVSGSASNSISKALRFTSINTGQLLVYEHNRLFDTQLGQANGEFEFGSVPVATSVTQVFVVANTGATTVTLNSFSSGYAEYTELTGFPSGTGTLLVDGTSTPVCNGSLAPGARCAIRVQFTPSTTTDFEGTFQISGTDLNGTVMGYRDFFGTGI